MGWPNVQKGNVCTCYSLWQDLEPHLSSMGMVNGFARHWMVVHGQQRLKANPRYLAQQNTWTTKECCRWSLQTNQTHFSTWTFPPSCVVAIHHCCHTCPLWWPWTCRRRRKLCNILGARNYIIIPVWWSGWKANTWPEPKHVKFKGGDENENESSPGTRRVVYVSFRGRFWCLVHNVWWGWGRAQW